MNNNFDPVCCDSPVGEIVGIVNELRYQVDYLDEVFGALSERLSPILKEEDDQIGKAKEDVSKEPPNLNSEIFQELEKLLRRIHKSSSNILLVNNRVQL